MNIIKRFFSPESLIKPSLVKGELPKSREAYRTAFMIAYPAVAEMVLVALIGMVDTVMVSSLGSYAIAAVGLTAQPRMLFISILMALNVGVTAIVSRRKGEGNPEDANLCLMQSLILSVLLGIILSVAGFFLTKPLIRLVGAKDDTFTPAVEYLEVIAVSLILPAISMSITAAQRGVGNTKISLRINIIANIFSVVFNYLLIGGNFGFPRLEVRGAAIATAIGSFAGVVVAVLSLMNHKSYLSFFKFGRLRFNIKMIRSMVKVGINAIFEQLFMRIGFFLYARIVADLGTLMLAAHLIGMQMMSLTFTIGEGLAVASSSLVGQNIGKNRPDLSIIYGKIGQRMAFCASLFMLAVIVSMRHIFAGFFTDDLLLISIVGEILIIMALLQPFQTTQLVMAGSLRGAGDTKFVAMTMLLTVAIARPLFAYLFMYTLGLGLHGAWVAIFFDQLGRLLMLSIRFSSGKWTYIRF